MLILLATFTGFTQNKKVYTVNDVAADGYDVVAYFNDNKAIEGKKDILSKLDGVIYQFSSATNKSFFDKNPDKYLPAYGGYCAYAMGVDGSKVKIDPETFKITDGKLYLFYNFGFTNTLPKWNKNENNLKSQADSYWDKLQK